LGCLGKCGAVGRLTRGAHSSLLAAKTSRKFKVLTRCFGNYPNAVYHRIRDPYQFGLLNKYPTSTHAIMPID
jgi:hypothetical protein